MARHVPKWETTKGTKGRQDTEAEKPHWPGAVAHGPAGRAGVGAASTGPAAEVEDGI